MATREQQVLALIRQDPMLPQQAIAARLGISRSAVAGHIMNLCNKGLIKGRGYVLSEAPFVAVIGGANVDIHGRSSQKLLDRDSNPGAVHTSAGGVARNIAENLARLGVECRLISAIGDDYHGQLLKRWTADAGVNTQYLHEIPAAATSSYLAVLDDSGELCVAVNDMSIIEHLTPQRLEAQKAMLEQASLLIVDCNLLPASLEWLTTTFAAKPIFADAVSAAKATRIRPQLGGIHTFKASAVEAAALFGQNARTLAELRSIAARLHAEGVARVFITRGENGVFFSTQDTHGNVKPTKSRSDLQSTGGAGDAFLAGIAYAWLLDWDLERSLKFALAAADLTLNSPATNNPALSVTAIHRALETADVG